MNFVTTDQIATQFDLNLQAVRRHIRNGAIRAIKVGRKYLIPQHELERLLVEGIPPLTITAT